MWFMNHIWNPIVRFILRSSLHGMLSKSTMLIAYTGKKTGKEITVPVSYLEDGQTVFVIPGNPESKVWWRNIQTETPVRLTLRGNVINARASLLTPEKDLDVMTHALDLFFQKMPAGAGLYKVRRDKTGSFNADDLKQAASGSVMIRIKPE